MNNSVAQIKQAFIRGGLFELDHKTLMYSDKPESNGYTKDEAHI